MWDLFRNSEAIVYCVLSLMHSRSELAIKYDPSSSDSGQFIINRHTVSRDPFCFCCLVSSVLWCDFSLAGPLFACIILWRRSVALRFSLCWNIRWHACQDCVWMSGDSECVRMYCMITSDLL